MTDEPSYYALRVSPRARAPLWWASAEAAAEQAPAAIRAILAGRSRIELDADEAASALAWARGVDGWEADGSKPVWVYPQPPAETAEPPQARARARASRRKRTAAAPSAPPALTQRFQDAVALAVELHGAQRRDGTEIPFVAHLLVVTGLVLEDGGDEDQAIASMLHDAVEDAGGRAALERIRARFGDRVASLVAEVSDSLDADDPRPWRARKADHLAHLPDVTDDGALRIALADKVHNARSIAREVRAEGHVVWERFSEKTFEDQLWYYRALLEYFTRRCSGPLIEDLRGAVSELDELVAQDPELSPPRADGGGPASGDRP